jgi:AAA15 family ATPase/GTPase
MGMLKRFAVTNFRGFKDRIEWDLSHPSNYEFHKEAIKDGIVNNGIIYGPNGAGKSNFSLAIFDIENHLSQKMKKIDYYQNFVYAGNPEELVKFEYLFQFGSDEVSYVYTKDAKGNLSDEQMLVNGQEIFNKTQDDFRLIAAFAVSDSMRESIMNNANHLSIVNLLLSSFPLNDQHYLIELQNFVNSMLWFRSLKANEYIGLETGVTQMEQYIIEHGLTDDFRDFIAEVSGQTFNFAPPVAGDKLLFCKIGTAQIPFSQIISTGTQSLILIYYWLMQLNKASFVFVDEFDAFYHFKLSFEVCKRLFAQNCQVYLSSHNTYLMTNDLLRPDCNFILNNNQIKSLIDCTEKDLRFGHNIEKLYRGGAFRS